jgi:hypothetical protein
MCLFYEIGIKRKTLLLHSIEPKRMSSAIIENIPIPMLFLRFTFKPRKPKEYGLIVFHTSIPCLVTAVFSRLNMHMFFDSYVPNMFFRRKQSGHVTFKFKPLLKQRGFSCGYFIPCSSS